jgi:hypothetical protein
MGPWPTRAWHVLVHQTPPWAWAGEVVTHLGRWNGMFNPVHSIRSDGRATIPTEQNSALTGPRTLASILSFSSLSHASYWAGERARPQRLSVGSPSIDGRRHGGSLDGRAPVACLMAALFYPRDDVEMCRGVEVSFLSEG